MDSCCFKGFKWDGTPSGRVDKLEQHDVYIAGNNVDRAILFIHDAAGWTYPNNRLLADHYAAELNASVYMPDFLGGEVLSFEAFEKGRFEEIDLQGFLARNSREIREPEIVACAQQLRKIHSKLAAIGYCYGGWAVFRLGAKQYQPPLMDCIVAGHPSLLTKDDIDHVGVPVQMLAPEFDPVYTQELKSHTFEKLQTSGSPFDYQHFPGVEHGCLTRGSNEKVGERSAMVRGKNAAISWMRQFLYE